MVEGKRLDLPGIPGGVVLGKEEEPSVDARFLMMGLQKVGELLVGISNQLDLMIRIESGARSKSSVKKTIEEFDAIQRAQQQLAVDAAAARESIDGVPENEVQSKGEPSLDDLRGDEGRDHEAAVEREARRRAPLPQEVASDNDPLD